MRGHLLIAGVAMVVLAAACDPGDPDPTYGQGGTAVWPDSWYGFAVAADGSVLSIYEPWGAESGTAVRIDPDGRVDPGWNERLDQDARTRIVPALDGGAYYIVGHPDLHIERVGPDGRVVRPGAPVVLPTTAILAARDVGDGLRLVVTEIVPDGPPPQASAAAIIDLDWDTGTVHRAAIDGPRVAAAALAADGSAVVVDFPLSDAAVDQHPVQFRRFDPDRRPDIEFGGDGTVSASEIATSCSDGTSSYVKLLASRPGDGPWLASYCAGHVDEIVRLRVDGTPDTTWSGGGLARAELVAGVPDTIARTVLAPQDDGTLLAVFGTCIIQPRFSCDAEVSWTTRLLADGTRDLEFGTDGLAVNSIGSISVVQQADTGIMLIGARKGVDRVVRTVVARLVGPTAP